MAPPLQSCRGSVADFKKERRYVASPTEWRKLRAEVLRGGKCLSCDGRATDAHHLVGRDLRGSDVLENLIPLCNSCHLCFEDRSTGWERIASSIREAMTDSQVGYVTRVKSQVFLDRYYARR